MKKGAQKSMETLPCKLALWGFLWLAWGRSVQLVDHKANRWPQLFALGSALREILKWGTCFPASGLLFLYPTNSTFPSPPSKVFFFSLFL